MTTTSTVLQPSTLEGSDGSNVPTADRIFEGIKKAKKLTDDGLNWLKTALDPFPDETRVVPGFPDMISSKSIRYPIKIETTIGDGGLGASWDCHIAFQGLFTSQPVRATTRANNTFQSTGQGATAYDLGGFQFRRGLTGISQYITDIVTNLLPTQPVNPYRVVSLGMEVENVTEPLYRSGSCVSYRMPSVPVEPTVSNISTLTTAASSAIGSFSLRELPNSAAVALNLPDSVSDSAENGTYMVGIMDGPTNPVNLVPASTFFNASPWIQSNAIDYFAQITGAALPFALSGCTNGKISYNSFGAYFTGLSSQTKLKVTMHAFIEEFVAPSSTLLSALATPSACYDPEALVLYSTAVRHLPVAVPVKDNFIGSFFLEAAKSIATWAAPKLLKGWDKSDETKELDKIKEELKLIKEMRRLEMEERVRVVPRNLVVSPTNGPRIVRQGVPAPKNPKPPPLPPRDYGLPRSEKSTKSKIPKGKIVMG